RERAARGSDTPSTTASRRASSGSREQAIGVVASLANNKMTESGDSLFHTGQPVWVMEPDGSSRPGEYIGEGETAEGLLGPPEALVIYVDRPVTDVVVIKR